MPIPFSRLVRLVAVLLCLSLVFQTSAAAASPLDAVTAKQQLQAHGVGKIVRITRRDGGELKGEIVSITDESLTLRPPKQAAVVTLPLTDVARVRGPGLSHGAKIGLTVGICVVVVVGIVAIVIDHKFKSGFPSTIPI